MIHNEHKIKNLNIIIKIKINLNNKLYKRAIKKQYFKQQINRTKNYIVVKNYKIHTKILQKQYNNFKTIFIKLNAIIFKKFKTKTPKNCVIFMIKKIISHKFINRKT